MLAHYGTVERSNADGYRCINSVLVTVLTKGQGGAILPMEDTNLQELEKVSRRGCDLASEIVKNRRNHAEKSSFLHITQSRRLAQRKQTSKTRLRKRKRLLKKKV